MRTTHTRRLWLLGTFVLPLALTQQSKSQVSIRVDGVPNQLSFPVSDGRNEILTATVKGGQIKSVWLAVDGAEPTSQRVMLIKTGQDEYAINLASLALFALLEPHGKTGQFHVVAETADGDDAKSIAVRYTLRAVPRRLDFPFDRAQLTIYQRENKRIPGSGGGLTINLGDITAGQVPVTIHGPVWETIVDTKSMREGDVLILPLTDHEYVLRLETLINKMIGRDYAIFTLVAKDAWKAQSVNDLLNLIAHSDATFVRNEQEIPGNVFAEHLLGKYSLYARKDVSLDHFIDNIASESSTTGKPYGVKLPNGKTLSARKWLLAKVDRTAEKKTGGSPAKSDCEMDADAFNRFLNTVEESGEMFMCEGKDLLSGADFARFLHLPIARLLAGDHCIDDFLKEYLANLEACGTAFEVKLPNGQQTPTAAWLRKQVERAVKGDVTKGDSGNRARARP